MSEQVLDHYRALIIKLSENAEACFSSAETKAAFLRCHSVLGDIGVMIQLTAERPEHYCVTRAQSEYQFALSALLNGHYRHSFASLRLSAELLLYGVYFSAHEVKLRQWLAGHRDLTWQALNDESKGVFSAPFVRAFNPGLVELWKKYSSLVVTAYRECSEFVHGNPEKSKILKDTLEFDGSIIETFESILQSLRLGILFCYIQRYLGNRDNSFTILESIIQSDFLHEEEIREFLK
jgi:hypothetical protein